MPLFLESCRRNPTIDFLFFGDGGPVPHVPANVTIVPLTFDEMLNRLNERLNLTVDVKDPYKLCDFKPAYGHVFEEYLQGYDFWGYTDFDLVYGNIRSFFTDELLERSDVVSCKPAWITGGCFLFRNTERLNTLFRLSNDHVRAFTSEERLDFLEYGYARKQLEKGISIFDADTACESMTEVIRREELNGLRVSFEPFEATPCVSTSSPTVPDRFYL